MTDILRGKTLVGLGDSLLYGFGVRPEEAWIALLGKNCGLRVINRGASGTTIARSARPNAMCERIEAVLRETGRCDYFLLQGGANDMKHNVPLGETESVSECDFCGAINVILKKARAAWPGCKILLMTNYDRRIRRNALGLTDEDYANAMLATSEARGLPVFDNFHDLGISIRDDACAWFFSDSQHLTPAANAWLAPRYADKLASL